MRTQKKAKEKIFILTNLLKFDADKNIKRYENIKRRTKKSRVKDKCDRKNRRLYDEENSI